jgi:hypothetical protein
MPYCFVMSISSLPEIVNNRNASKQTPAWRQDHRDTASLEAQPIQDGVGR